MEFRFDNEDLLLKKAMSRQYFGWGGFGRGRLYDSEMGKEITIADGQWIIVLSMRGVVGLFCYLGILLVPIFAVRKRFRKIKDPKEKHLLAGATLILAVYCTDMIPNSAFSVMPFIVAGAIWTVSANMAKGVATPKTGAVAPPPQALYRGQFSHPRRT